MVSARIYSVTACKTFSTLNPVLRFKGFPTKKTRCKNSFATRSCIFLNLIDFAQKWKKKQTQIQTTNMYRLVLQFVRLNTFISRFNLMKKLRYGLLRQNLLTPVFSLDTWAPLLSRKRVQTRRFELEIVEITSRWLNDHATTAKQ